MHALRFDHFGGPDVLDVEEMPDAAAGGGEAVVAVKSSSVNPSDLRNVAGSFQQTTLPRIPGRDFAGVVVDGPGDWIGAEVWGTGGDIGFTRDGPHAEMLTIPAASLARKPERLSFEEASSVGVNFLTGWIGLVEAAQLAKRETVAVFGVSGGVGGAVAQIAHALGSRVIGGDRVRPADGTPAASVIQEFVVLDGGAEDVGSQIKRVTGGRGADVVFDAVGGVTTPAALASLAPRGRLVVISAVGRQTVEINLVTLYRNETRIYGCNSGNYDVVQSGALLKRLTPFFDAGQFRPLPVTRRYSLEDGKDAYLAVENRVRGRVVICP
ncbi:MAG TPA: zinc-binding alcohol dehydrogenase family protein [Streptosporangiaceae bacterium]|nr:zinc-binding alcohol dehydrogenase family protein [Streptosporangiaceae bacterium]